MEYKLNNTLEILNKGKDNITDEELMYLAGAYTPDLKSQEIVRKVKMNNPKYNDYCDVVINEKLDGSILFVLF